MSSRGNDLGNLKKIIGQKLQSRRIEMGFHSQSALADKIGVDTSRVNRWENGRNIPDLHFKHQLCVVLDIQLDFFETVPDVDSEPSKADLVLQLIEILPALDDDELRGILALAQAAPSQLARAKRTTI